ncbi:TlpA disulfide reductase family protein [Aestuariibius sp. HNIBRBA575]|uniref:TlpA disulfide reductase family protein n=1 Tax=Aestuariibius sp. HNIBRBA575 TaxID=3233343 RepID=UPI0034A25022
MKVVRKIIGSALLYTAVGFSANTALADMAELDALRVGDMRKLTFHSEPVASTDATFESSEGMPIGLGDYEGQFLVLNFWATWCAPCRKEMPSLSALQTEFGGPDFNVLTVATGRNPPAAIERFFDEIEVSNLPYHRDPRQGFARSMGVLGLPVTIILDRDGQEIARLQGDADWHSDSARAIVAALIASDPLDDAATN